MWLYGAWMVSIHAFRGEGDVVVRPGDAELAVSIHAFRGEGDRRRAALTLHVLGFNPRLPGGRRRAGGDGGAEPDGVSIHAFRGEGDLVVFGNPDAVDLVSIHAFRGEGDERAALFGGEVWSFNPRLPGGRRPVPRAVDSVRQTVSIHAFRGEGDPDGDWRRWPMTRFNPRLPGGRRHFAAYNQTLRCNVSIHAFRGEGDQYGTAEVIFRERFNPRLPGGRRQPVCPYRRGRPLFQSTPSGGKATAISRAAVPCSRQIL